MDRPPRARPEEVRALVDDLSPQQQQQRQGSEGDRTANAQELARLLSQSEPEREESEDTRGNRISPTRSLPSLGRVAASTTTSSSSAPPSSSSSFVSQPPPPPPPVFDAAGVSDIPRRNSESRGGTATSRRPADFGGAARMFNAPEGPRSSRRPANLSGARQVFATPEATKRAIRQARAERESLATLVRSVRSRGVRLSRGARDAARAALSARKTPIPSIPRKHIDAEELQQLRAKVRQVREAHRNAVGAIEEDIRGSAREAAKRLSVAAAPAPERQANEAPADMLKRLRQKFNALVGANAATAAANPAPKAASRTRTPPKAASRTRTPPPPPPPPVPAPAPAPSRRTPKAKPKRAAAPTKRSRSDKALLGRARADPKKLLRRIMQGRDSSAASMAQVRAMFGSPPAATPAAAASRRLAAAVAEPKKPRRKAAAAGKAGRAAAAAAAARSPPRGVRSKRGARCSVGFHRGPGDLCYPKEAVAEVRALIKGKVPARRRRKIERKVGAKLPSALGFPVPATLSREPSSLRRMHAGEQTLPRGLRVVKTPPSNYRIERKRGAKR